MAAQIPVRDNPEATEEAFAKVRADKVREAEDGHDGTWVAHPALVPVAKAVFDQYMPGPNQIHRQREDVEVTARDLLTIPKPVVTEDGLRLNIRAALLYMEAWLRGTGCVPINNLMEDTATAEISRAQLWQWLHHRARLADGRRISLDLYRKLATEELQSARSAVGAKAFQSGRYTLARGLLDKLVTEKLFHEFFTQFALDYLE
jgi:malate synthase